VAKRRRTDNTVAKRRRTDNTVAKRKKGQKDKQRSTKNIHATKDRVTQTLIKPGMNSDAPEG